jgi:alpha-beta hydrolase superfamily lysophospholipase
MIIQHNEASLRNAMGQTLRIWSAVPDRPVARLLIVHGFLEHSGRYIEFQDRAAEAGLAVTRYDCRGHGLSDGKRAHIDRYEEYIADLDQVRREAVAGPADLPLFVLGHSQGGLKVIRYGLDDRSAGLAGIISLSPALGLSVPIPAWKSFMGNVMSVLWPSLGLDAGIDKEHLTHDPESKARRDNDKLIGENARARWFTETLLTQATVRAAASNFSLPLLLLIAGDDRLVDASEASRFGTAAGSEDKTVHVYDGLYHELLQELERLPIHERIIDWVLNRSGGAS